MEENGGSYTASKDVSIVGLYSRIERLGEIAPLPVGKFISDLPTCASEVQMIEIPSDSPKPLVNFVKLLYTI